MAQDLLGLGEITKAKEAPSKVPDLLGLGETVKKPSKFPDLLGIAQEPPELLETKLKRLIGTDPTSGFKALYTGLKSGAYDFYSFLGKSADLLSKATGLSKGGLFKNLAQMVKPSDRELSEGDIFTKIVKAVGAAPGTITKYALPSAVVGPIAGMGAVGAIEEADKGIGAAAIGAAKEATLGAGLKYTAPFTTGTRAALTGGLFGAAAATEPGAGVEDVLTSVVTGAGLGALSKGGDLRIRDLIPDLEGTRQKLINRVASIENLVREAEKRGAKIRPGENPAIGARSYPGVGMKFKSVLEKETYRARPDGTFEVTGEGLSPILKDYDRISPERSAAIRERDLDSYLIARRYLEDLQRPKGDYTQEQIASPEQIAKSQADLTRLTQKYGSLDHFESISPRLYDFQKRVLRLLVDSGQMSQERFDAIVRLNPHYIPFQRVMDDIDPGGGILGPKAQKPFTEARSPVQRIKGSEREIQPPLETIVKNTFRIIDTSHRNMVWRGVYDLRDVMPEAVQEVHVKMYPIRVDPKEIKTAISRFVDRARQVTSTTTTTGAGGQTSGPIARLEGVIVESLKLRGMTEPEANNALQKIKQAAGGTGQNIQTTIKEMITQTTRILQEPVESTIFRPSQFKPKGNALEGFVDGKRKYIEVSENLRDAMSGLNEVSLGLFTKIMSKPAQALRVGATITPEFISRNFIRDQFTAFMQSRLGFRPFVDPAGAIADILGKSDVYYEWLRSGGGYSAFTEVSHKNLEKIVKELQGKKSLLSKLNIIARAEDVSQVVEMSTRLGMFKAELRKGTSPAEAGIMAREGTVDFAVKGSQTKDVNAMIAFFGAGVQSSDRMIRAFRNDPAGMTAKGIAAITIPEILLYLKNREDPDYKELPRWEKDLFWMVYKMEDGSFVRVLKPYFYGQLFGSSVGRFMEYLDKEDPAAFKGIVQSLIESASPVQGDPAAVLIPTALKPLVENATGWSFFRERPVVSEWEKKMLPYRQYNKYTTEFSKEVGELMGEMPATSWLFKGGYSPAKIDNLVQGFFGGLGRYALEAGSKVIEYAKGEKTGHRPTELADIPLVKGFVTRPAIAAPQSLYDFYDRRAELNAAYNTYLDALKEGDASAANKIVKDNPKLFLSKYADEFAENINSLNQQIYLLSKDPSLSDDKKREEIRKREVLRMKMVLIGKRMLAQ